MAKAIEIKFGGNWEAALDRLEESVGESALRSAGYAGAKVFQDEAQLRVPVKTGFIKSQIIVKRIPEQSQGNLKQTYYVRVRSTAKQYKNTSYNRRLGIERVGKAYEDNFTAFYWKFLEFGTSKMPAKPFIRPAFESKISEALTVMRVTLGLRIKEARSRA